MADLNDVYGQTYQNESKAAKINYIINNMANNIAHRQFNFRISDTRDLWDPDYNMNKQVMRTLVDKVKGINKMLYLVHIDKQSDGIGMLPELVIDSPVEYFWIIDGEMNRAYYIFITPYEVTAY